MVKYSQVSRHFSRTYSSVVEQIVDNELQSHVYDINDAFTRANISLNLRNSLTHLRSQRSIYDFMVVCDETNNPPSDNNQLKVDVYYKKLFSDEFTIVQGKLSK